MKFERTPRFDSDYRRLPKEQRQQFKEVIGQFSAACDEYAVDPAGFAWPRALRVSRKKSVRGIWEMTWSFASPDGRATFEFIIVDGQMRLRWRRIGNHSIYRQP